VAAYGVADLEDETADRECFRVDGFVEKPAWDEAPSNLAITGRYVFTSDIFERLDATEPGVGGELQLTDAIRKLPAVRGVKLRW